VLGEVLTHYHYMFNKTDTLCCQIKMGMVAYLGADHHMFIKIDTTCNMSIWVWWRTWVLCRPLKWVPDVVIIFYVSQVSCQTYIKTMQPRPFEEWIKKGTPTRRQPVRCLCTPHKRTLFGEGKRGLQPRLFCILCQGVWGMWRVALSLANTEARPSGTPQTGYL